MPRSRGIPDCTGRALKFEYMCTHVPAAPGLPAHPVRLPNFWQSVLENSTILFDPFRPLINAVVRVLWVVTEAMDGSDPARIEQGDWPSKVVVSDKCMLGFPTSKAHYQVDVYATPAAAQLSSAMVSVSCPWRRRHCWRGCTRWLHGPADAGHAHGTPLKYADSLLHTCWRCCDLGGGDLVVMLVELPWTMLTIVLVCRSRHWTPGRSLEGDEWAGAVHSFWCRWVSWYRQPWPGVAIADPFGLRIVARRIARQGR
jgi:hypothetical protein